MALQGYNEPFLATNDLVTDNKKPSVQFMRWLEQSLGARLQQTPTMADPLTTVPAGNVTALGTIGGQQTAGLYQVLAYIEVTTADAGGTPNVELAIMWTRGGKSLSTVYPALSGTTVTNTLCVSTVVQIDANTTIGYTLTRTDGTTPGLFAFLATLGAMLILPVQG